MPSPTPGLSATLTPLCERYTIPKGAHDEMCLSPGGVRGHWQYLARVLGDMGLHELSRREDEARRLVRENDVTYNIYGDPQGLSRSWPLDLIPLLIESEEWRGIEAGLMQRAEILNHLLADLYGPRAVIRKGLLPLELVYSHPGFLRPCVGIPLPRPRALTFYAADLGRSADGQMWVLGDRTQAPSGAGYALENRIVISRVLPSLFRDAHVHRLATFFRTLRKQLAELSPRGVEYPNIVLLTPGPANETYFEHAYLANYLGYSLVQGDDLTVRDGRVWLTTLEGRQPVDVILRRLDDNYCDPVELKEDSFLGIPGLVQVARTGAVTIANPLGSGVIENPALLAFLPALSRHFLGEDLRLPSVETWWCGDAQGLAHVLANLENLVIKPVHPGLGGRRIFCAELSNQQRQELRDRIAARPAWFVGQATMCMSTTPVLTAAGLEARHTVMRSFLVADGADYLVMPGGLTRVSQSAERLVVSGQAGGISKDTWVLASEPERETSLLPERGEARPGLGQIDDLPARVADNLFWVGRYAERAEFVARLLRLILQYDFSGSEEESGCLRHLLAALTQQTTTYPGFVGEGADQRLVDPEPELLAVITDVARRGGLAQSLQGYLTASRSVRDRLSSDTWRVVNQIDEELRSLQQIAPGQLGNVADELDNLVNALTAFAGLTQENITRGRGWLFLELGRRLERAIHTVRLLRSTLVPATGVPQQRLLYESVLAVVDSLMSYRRHYRDRVDVARLLELLLYNERNPRSLGFQLAHIEAHVAELPREPGPLHRSPAENLALEMVTAVRLADLDALSAVDAEAGSRVTLDHYLQHLGARLPALSDALTASYLRPAAPPHQLLRMGIRGGS